MLFNELELAGAFVIDLEPRSDARGFFARAWCAQEFAAHGLVASIAQINVGSSHIKGTLRGMHFQSAPCTEVKVAYCTAGAIYDVIIDLRPESPTFKRWAGVELSAHNHRALYVPEGFAHGYQTLTDNAEMSYMTSQPYAPAQAGGVRYNDAAFDIAWPLPVTSISEADARWSDFTAGSLVFSITNPPPSSRA